MTFSFARMSMIALGVAAVSAQGFAADAPKDPVVATVNGTEIHESALRDIYVSLPDQAKRVATPRKLAESAVDNKLVSDEARKENLTTDPEVKRALKIAEDQILVQAWVKKHGTVNATDDQLKKKYDELVAGYKPHEEIRAHHVLLETEDQAKAVIADLRGGASFEDIAKAKSKDPSAAQNSGDLGFFAKEQMAPEFADAVNTLRVGEVSAQPVKTQYGWHVIRVDEKRMSSAPPFADAKEEVRRILGQQALQDAAKALRDKAKIEIKVADNPPQSAPGK